MKEKDFIKALNSSEEKQLDMLYWKFSAHEDMTPSAPVKPIKIASYNSSMVIATRFYKIIRF
jgi:hypothetical protein